MKEYSIGLDVHKYSVFMAVLDDRKVRSSDRADSDVAGTEEVPTHSPRLIKAIKGCQGKGKVFVACEAGCLDFDLYHFLGKHGIACQIIPADTVFRPGNEKKIKTDRRDAVLVGRMLKRWEAKGIRIPSREEEAERDYIRGWGNLMKTTGTGAVRILNGWKGLRLNSR